MDNIFSSVLTAAVTFIALHLTFQRDRDNRMYDKIDTKADKADVEQRLNRLETKIDKLIDNLIDKK